MNKVFLTGRITKDPEVRMTPSNLYVCSFTMAVDRKFKDSNGEKQTDFIPCVGWRKVAELLGNYCHKGSKIAICGSVQTRSYEDQSGRKVFVTEVLAEEIEFLDTKKQETQQEEIRPIPPAVDVATTEEEVALPFDIYGY